MRLVEVITDHRWLVLVLLAGITAGLGVLALGTQFDFSPQAVYSGGDDLVAFSEDFKQTFGHEDAVLLVVLEATGERDVLAAEALTWQGRIAGELARVDQVVAVRSPATLKVPAFQWRGPPWIVVRPVVDRFPVTAGGERRVRRALSRATPAMGAMLSADRRAAAVLVALAPEARHIDATRQVVRQVRGVLASAPPPAGYRLHLSGLPAVRGQIVDDLLTTQTRLMPMVGGLYLVIFLLIFRRVWGALLPLIAVGTLTQPPMRRSCPGSTRSGGLVSQIGGVSTTAGALAGSSARTTNRNPDCPLWVASADRSAAVCRPATPC